MKWEFQGIRLIKNPCNTEPNIGIAIPSYQDGELALKLCWSFLQMPIEIPPLSVAIVSNGPNQDCFDGINVLKERFHERGWKLEHEHLDQPGKCAALNRAEKLIGDECAGIIYLDADIELDVDALRGMAHLISDGSIPMIVAPKPEIIRPSNFIVAAFGAIWIRLPHVRKDVVGAGCFAVTRAGRLRWKKWPQIISDDGFARLMFSANERFVDENSNFRITMPELTRDLIKVRGRRIRGSFELLKKFPGLRKFDNRRKWEGIWYFLIRLWLYPACLIYLCINFTTKIYLVLRNDTSTLQWEQESSSKSRHLMKQ